MRDPPVQSTSEGQVEPTPESYRSEDFDHHAADLEPVRDTTGMALEDILQLGIGEAVKAQGARARREHMQHRHNARVLLLAALRLAAAQASCEGLVRYGRGRFHCVLLIIPLFPIRRWCW